ncbi:MAG TPA: hypothetical protein VFK48_15060 [Usitatibacter sp.]|nr:hypothetical protein [Usitatibacter sp.]
MAKLKTRADESIERALDDVVGRYEPHAGERLLRRYGSWIARAALAACLAAAAMAVVFLVLHKHLKDAQTAPAPKKPVLIHILPAQE